MRPLRLAAILLAIALPTSVPAAEAFVCVEVPVQLADAIVIGSACTPTDQPGESPVDAHLFHNNEGHTAPCVGIEVRNGFVWVCRVS